MDYNQGKNETAASIEPSQQPGKSKKPILISLAVIVLLGISGTVYAMFFNLSPKETYFAAEKNTMEQTQESFNKTFAVNEDVNKKMIEEPSKSTLTLGLKSIDGLQAIDPNMAMFASMLNDVKLSMSAQLNPEKNEGLAELKAGMGGTEFIKAEAYQSEDLTGLNVPLLYNNYLYLNNDQFGKVMKKFDPAYQGPEEIDNVVKMQLEAMRNQEKYEEHADEYGKFLLEKIKDENVTEKSGVEFQGKKYTQLTLALSEKETKDILKALIDKVREDEELLNFLIEANGNTAFTAPGMETADMKETIQTELKKASDNIDQVKIPDGFKSVILIDKNEVIVKRDVDFKIGNDSEFVVVDYSSHALRSDDLITDGKWEINVFPENGEKQDYGKMLVEIKGKKGDGDNATRDITGTFAFAEAGKVTGANLSAKITGTPEDMKADFEAAIDDPSNAGIPPLKGHFTRKVTDDLDNGTYSSNGEFGLEVDAGLGAPINVTFDYDSKTEFTKNLKFPNVTEDGENVAEMSPEEMERIMTEIQTRIQGMMMNGPQMFN
ncbi:DUF6583 family protein [Alkalihalobacillus sp. TS-13]|uniref:DUF6583 family protein n=1 Tax=Alkalihalobacillus sp. TS-13 TaxID=2842455 RepID=UPI001C87501C|nr:DUF6583 family protein [Alkalihalobacillus sp. TS-13]